MNRPVDRDAPSIPIVRLADRRVQRFVVDVNDLRTSGRAEFDRAREPPDQQRRMKSWTFCPCVMPANAAYCRPTKTPP
jgi:hypothetical protein